MGNLKPASVFRAMDELDAIAPASALLYEIAREEHQRNQIGLMITHCPTATQALAFKCDNFPQGMYLWRNAMLIAQFTVVRDDKNWSVCVFNDLREVDNVLTK